MEQPTAGKNRTLGIVIGIGVAILLVLTLLLWRHRQSVAIIQPITAIHPTPTATAIPISTPIASASPTEAPPKNTSTPSSQPSTEADLITPYGSFVSNHRPTQSGTPGPNEQSVCNTTNGASCIITFTKGGETKSLPSETSDSTGSTYWNWDINTLGLDSGEWTISTVASLGGQTKTAVDTLPIEVSP